MTQSAIDLRVFAKTPLDITERHSHEKVTAVQRLGFAKGVLWALLFFVLLVVIGYALDPMNPALAEVFAWVKIGALPLVTLVIGFYFPSASR